MAESNEYEMRVGGKYTLTHRLGSGSFATIYLANDVTNGEKVACKMSSDNSFLVQEAKLLKSLSGLDRFPHFKWFGHEGDYDVLVMSLMGPSLADLFKYCDKQFSMKSSLILMDQALQCLESLHDHHIVHRDIKPDNFCIGVEEKSEILHVLDFGLSKIYRDSITQTHIEYKDGKGMTGTPRYASMNAHRGIELSRRDDLESLGYTIIYFIKGSLPWQGVKAANKHEKSLKILEQKRASIESGQLFEGLPCQFKEYFDLVLDLGFEDTPNYGKLRRLMKELFLDRGYNYIFDWQVGGIENEDESDSDNTKDTSVANKEDDSNVKEDELEAQKEVDITARLGAC